MANNNFFGNQIKISNSNVYGILSKNYDILSDIDNLSLELSIKSLCDAFSDKIAIDKEKIGLFLKLMILSKIDGGKLMLDFINSNLSQEKRVNSIDICLNNLEKIFLNLDDLCEKSCLDEFFDLIEDHPSTYETKIIDVCIKLEIMSQHLNQAANIDPVDFIFDNIKKILNYYHINKDITIPIEFQGYLNKMVAIDNLNQNNITGDVYDILNKYKQNNLTKKEFINSLQNSRLYEKKNKTMVI